MELTTLGGVALHGDVFSERKPLLLLAYLALRGVRTRAHAAEFLWPDSEPSLQRKSLSEALRKLRRLGPDVIVEPDDERIGTDLGCDAKALLSLVREDVGEDPTHACQRVLELYRGPFLDGLEGDRRLGLGPGAVEWILETRDEIHVTAEDAILRCAERMARNGLFRMAASAVARGLDELPDVGHFPTPNTIERRHVLLLAGGDSFRAEREAETAREAYGDLDLATDPSAAQARLDVRRELPPVPDPFLGRDAEGGEILERLAESEARAVAVTGLAGIGKTALIAAVARRARDVQMFEAGTSYVSLSQLPRESLESDLVEYLASTLSLAPLRNDALALARAFGTSEHLLVLDDVERIAHLPEVLAALVEHSSVRLLLGSRVHLDLPRSVSISLTGLPTADSGEAVAHDPDDVDAVQLFRHIAASRGVDLGEDDAASVRSVVSVVDGHPLAIRLAASWCRVLPVADVAERLESSWDLYADSPLEAALAEARNTLGDEVDQALLALAPTRGGLAVRDASHLGLEPSALRMLVRHDLLRYDPARERYSMHAIVAAEARSRLKASSRAAPFVERHARHYLARLHDVESTVPDVRTAAPALLAPDIANIEAAWRWAIDGTDWTVIADHCSPLERLGELTGRVQWASECLSDALMAMDDVGDSPDDVVEFARGCVEARLAWTLMRMGDSHRGLEMARRAQIRLEGFADADTRHLLMAFHAEGAILDDLGHFDSASTAFEQALAIAEAESPYAATTLLNLGVNASLRGRYKDAEQFLRRALDIYTRHRRVTGQLHVSRVLANVLIEDDRPLDAKIELDARRDLVDASGALRERTAWYLRLSEACLALGRTDEAEVALERSAQAGPGNFEDRVWRSMIGARLHTTLGRHDRAEQAAMEGLTIACEHKAMLDVPRTLVTLLEVRAAADRLDPRDASLAGAVRALMESGAISVDARKRALRLFSNHPELGEQAPPPWLGAALAEPSLLLRRAERAS